MNRDRRDGARASIFELCDKYPKNYYVVSSRPDAEFIGWERFAEMNAMPLSKSQALELASKLDYDEEVKQRFVKELAERLYDAHKSFLSNPLLLTIMLLTYDENAEIPGKTHLFYQQVFEALFNKHDALKAGYKRQMYTPLAQDDFARVLSSISIQSYIDGLLTFGVEKLHGYISNAKTLSGITVDPANYTEDLLKSVCILSKDGQFYTYAHKQFQEYFAALFINNASADSQKELLKVIVKDYGSNELVRILYEINPSLIEQYAVLTQLQNLFRRLKVASVSREESATLLAKIVYQDIRLEEGKVYFGIKDVGLFEFVRLVRNLLAPSIQGVPHYNSTKGTMLRDKAALYGKKKKMHRVPISTAFSHQPLKDALINGSSCSIDVLNYLIDARDFIIEKHKKRSAKVTDILVKKPVSLSRLRFLAP